MEIYHHYDLDPQFQLLGTVFITVYGVFALFSLVSYFLGSFGQYRIAKRRGIHHAWLSWIPFGKSWILGCISDQYRYVARNERKNRRKILLISQIIGTLLSGTWSVYNVYNMVRMALLQSRPPYFWMTGNDQGFLLLMISAALCFVCGVFYTVFKYIAYYDLYLSCSPDNCVLFLVMSILFPVTLPFFVFAVRNKDGGMPPRKGTDIPGQPQWHPGQESGEI